MNLPRALTHNAGWKLVALLVASLIWITLNPGAPRRPDAPSSRRFPQMPVAILTAAAGGSAFRVEPATVDVTLHGDEESLAHVRPADIQVYVNLTTMADIREPRRRVQAIAPTGMTVVEMSPPEVLVRPLGPVPPADLSPRR